MMKKLFTLVSVCLAVMVSAQNPGNVSTGTDPGGTGGTRSLGGSYVAFDPAQGGEICFTPGIPQDFVFLAESFSPDWEYVYNVWLKFPDGWVVNSASVVGTPYCDNGGSWGSFSFTVDPSNTVNIYHPRYQMAGGDHCVAYYMVNVTPAPLPGDADVSWYWDGDGYGSTPHWPCSSDGYTPPGQEPCDEQINPPALIPACSPAPGPCIPGWQDIATEPDIGRMDNVLVSYNGLIWSIAGYGSNNDVRYYDPASDTWASVPSSAFGSNNYARSGAAYGSKAYIYGDATGGYTGLWSYDMAANVWANESPSGTPPPYSGIWAPAWVTDPETGYMYITGGATASGGGNLTTVYVYDPATNAWLAPLPNFTTPRDLHAAFIFTHPGTGHKMLAIAGGVDINSVVFSSTQCYDFVTGIWNAENADIPPLPEARWGMGYTHNIIGLEHQLWLIGGVDASFVVILPGSVYYDPLSGMWIDGGVYHTTPVYRTSAIAFEGDVYKISGSSGGFAYTGLSSKYETCGPASIPIYNWALYIGILLIAMFAVIRFRRS